MLHWTLPDGYRGLIFDCDGTLVDSMPLHYHAWVTIMHRHGLEISEPQFYQFAGVPVVDIVHQLAIEQGRAVDAQAIADERDQYFHSLPSSELRPVVPVVDIARHYHRQLPMAVATGSTLASARTSLQSIGVFDWFDAVISSHEVELPKPAPDVFLLAAERIGIAPEQCVAFEDGDAGLIAARDARMEAVDIRPWLLPRDAEGERWP